MKKDILFKDVLKKLNLEDDAVVTRLAGDASTREYYRIVFSGGSYILMKQDVFNSDNEPFVVFQKLYKSMNLPVPFIHSLYPQQGVMVLQDLGDKHLQNMDELNPLFKKYYTETVNILYNLQLQKNNIDVSFTHQKFLNELKMTTDYYLGSYKQKQISLELNNELNNFYQLLVDKMMQQKQFLQHRDYHSRNLLIHEDSIYVIDFQDSRLGPYPYDLASLIIDPYANLSEDISQYLIKKYYNKVKNVLNIDYYQFYYDYSICFLQRGIKILGTFAYQHVKNYNDVYLQYIPITIEKIKHVLKGFPEWEAFIDKEILT